MKYYFCRTYKNKKLYKTVVLSRISEDNVVETVTAEEERIEISPFPNDPRIAGLSYQAFYSNDNEYCIVTVPDTVYLDPLFFEKELTSEEDWQEILARYPEFSNLKT